MATLTTKFQLNQMEERFRSTPSFNNPYTDVKSSLPKLKKEDRTSIVQNNLSKCVSASTKDLSNKQKNDISHQFHYLNTGKQYVSSKSKSGHNDNKKFFSRQIIRQSDLQTEQSTQNSLLRVPSRLSTSGRIALQISQAKLINQDKNLNPSPQRNTIQDILKNQRASLVECQDQFQNVNISKVKSLHAKILSICQPLHGHTNSCGITNSQQTSPQKPILEQIQSVEVKAGSFLEVCEIKSELRGLVGRTGSLSIMADKRSIKRKNNILIKLQGNIIKKLFKQ